MKKSVFLGSITVILTLLTAAAQGAQIYTGAYLAGSLYGNGNASGSGPYAGNSVPLVSDFLTKQADVAAGTNTATELYTTPSKMGMWGDLASVPPTYTDARAQGGGFYYSTVITGLTANDYVYIGGTASYKAPGGTSYAPISTESYYYDIGTYSRVNDGTIYGELTKIVQEVDLSFTFYATAYIYWDWTGFGAYDYWPTEAELNAFLDYNFMYDETIEIYSDGYIDDDDLVADSRGIIKATALTGASAPTMTGTYIGYGTVVIPEPTTIALLLLSFIGMAVKKFKK